MGKSTVVLNGIEYEGDGDVAYDNGVLTIGGKPAVRASAAYKSTDDRRATVASPQTSTTGMVACGAFRSVYRPLSDAEKDLIDRIKLHAEGFHRLLAEAGKTDPASDRLGSASLTLAFRHVEDAVYRAVKHVTGPSANDAKGLTHRSRDDGVIEYGDQCRDGTFLPRP